MIKGKFPLLTSAIIGLCTLLFLLSNFASEYSHPWLAYWGYFSNIDVYSGSYWGLLTSSFLHVDFLHAIFNLYWVWILGSGLEKHLGSLNFLIFWILAAFVSSGFQLAFSGDTGIGASGVVYAIFGYQFIARKHVEPFSKLMNANTIQLFIIWLFLCLGLTYFNVWNIGNAAHFSGFGFGCLCGYLIELKQNSRMCFNYVALVALFIASSLVYAPWSSTWIYKKAGEAYEKSNYAEAIDWYSRIPEKSEYYPYAAYWMGNANELLGDHISAVALLEEALAFEELAYPKEELLNHLAWMYATSINPKLQKSSKALQYASAAYKITDGQSPEIIDTLAAAHAANGNFEKAVELQKEAIKLAKDLKTGINIDGYEYRLSLFEKGRSFVE